MGFFKNRHVFLPKFQLEIKDNNLSHNIKKIKKFLSTLGIFPELLKKKCPENSEN